MTEESREDAELFIDYFRDWIAGKVNAKVAAEYIRIIRNFWIFANRTKDPVEFQNKIREYLNVENPNTYRNRLAALKKLFEFIGEGDRMNEFKYKTVMPTFSIKTPSLEDVQKFGRAIKNDRVRTYYYLGVVSAIRPEHLLRLSKKLFDKPNNMINTFMKTFGKKNFFFSFYTAETKQMIESYVDDLTDNELLFPVGMRYIQKEFVKASKISGVKMEPKMMRKFSTNWLRRHGMIPEDVDVITSHVAHSVVAKHYLDVSRIHEEYDKATTDLKLLT